MSRTLRRLAAGAVLLGSLAVVAVPAQASITYCKYYVIAGRVIRVCPPVL